MERTRKTKKCSLVEDWPQHWILQSAINQHLVNNAQMPLSNIKWFIRARRTIKPDTFTKFLTFIFDTFPEAQAKLLANGFIGDLGRKYNKTDQGFT